MEAPLTIALDTMGGDNAPDIVLRGADVARKRLPNVRFLMVGDEAQLEPRLRRMKSLAAVADILHAPDVVSNDARVSVALRQGRDSSMQRSISAVKEGRASVVVSAGNTGALMAMAKLSLKTLPGIDRPAIAGLFPTIRGESVMLDLGANIDCDARNLVQFAAMGGVFARAVLGAVNPTVGLLNVGSEEMKGHDEIRLAAAMLREMQGDFSFYGFVEGDDIATGTVDVVVTDGFTGNVALKTAEGTVKLVSDLLRQAFRSSFSARLGYLLARNGLAKMRARIDPRRHNGAMLLGLNGVVIKSHGGTDSFGFANAISVGADMALNDMGSRIVAQLANDNAGPTPSVQAAAS